MDFRYKSLMNLRRGQESLAQKKYGTINGRLIAQQKSLEALDKAEQNNKRRFDRRLNENMDVKTRILFYEHRTDLKHRKSIQQSMIAETKAQLEMNRKELVSAAIKRKTMELLKKRDSQLAKKQIMKREINIIDETAIQWRG